MITTSTGYQNMVAGHTLTFTDARVQVNLPGLGWTVLPSDDVKIDAAFVTDQPAGTRFEVGYPSLAMTFTFNDKAGLFAPYNTASALYRKNALQCAVVCDIGTPTGTNGATEWMRKFTGQVDTYDVSDFGVVSFTCIDNRSTLRASGALAAVVTVPPYNAGLTSEFAVDYLLRACSNGAVSSWPAQRAKCIFAAGFRGSLAPERGALLTQIPGATSGYFTQPPPTFAPGHNGTGLQLVNMSTITDPQTWQGNAFSAAVGDDVTIEFNVTGLAGSGMIVELQDNGPDIDIQLTVSPTGIKVQCNWGTPATYIADYTWTTTIDASTHSIMAHIHFPVGTSSFSGTLWVDGTSQAIPATTPLGGNRIGSPTYFTLAAHDHDGIVVDSFQMSGESAPSPVNYTFVPTAVLDPSLNALQVVPGLDAGFDVWQTIQQIADAEQAVAGFDETGLFYFKNRDTLRSSASVATLTSDVSLKTLSMNLTAASLANRVQVPYQGWLFGKSSTAWTSASDIVVAPRSTVTFPVTTTNLAAQVDAAFSNLPNGHYPLAGGDLTQSWFRFSADASGVNELVGPTVTAQQVSPNEFNLIIKNPTGTKAHAVSPSNYTDLADGSPTLWLAGIPVTQGNQLTADTGTTFKAHPTDPDVTYQAAVNPWLQDAGSANALAFHIADDMSGIQPLLTGIDIVPRPDLQLGDRITLSDPIVTGISEQCVLWGWTFELKNGQDSMQIDARAIAAPGQWILDDNTRSVLDSTTYI